MRMKYMMPVAVTCLAVAAAFGLATQGAKGLGGKWGTDAAVAKAANPTAPAGANAVMLDIKVDASNKVTGSITEFGNALCGSPDTKLPIDSGMVDAKVVTFVTTRPNPCPAADAAPGTPVTGTQVTWTGTLGDDDSLSVTRAIAGGGRGGGGGGGRGGGAPGAGGPPAGGPPPAAAGAAPAGGPPAGGPPPAGAGGGGGRGGGRGGGGAMVMHRIP